MIFTAEKIDYIDPALNFYQVVLFSDIFEVGSLKFETACYKIAFKLHEVRMVSAKEKESHDL